jgi:uncharacterized membrane protein YagU involved in acid resistance
MITTMVPPRTIANRSAIRGILTGAVIAGVLDATFAVIVDVVILRAFSLLGVLQWIASGLLGKAAFEGGLATAALGVAIHFALAAVFAAFYYAVSTRIGALRTQAVTFGVTYGAAIWLLMDLVILPRSGAPLAPFDPVVFGAFLIDHMAFVGLPIALAVKRYAP